MRRLELPFGAKDERVPNNQSDLTTLVTKALGLQRRPPGLLEPEVGLSVTVESFERMEFDYLRGRYTFEVSGVAPAVAAETGMLLLTPSSSAPNTLVVIEQIEIINLNVNSNTFRIGWTDTPPFPATTVSSLLADARMASNRASLTVAIGSVVGPAPLTPNRFIQVTGNNMVVVKGPWVLSADNKVGNVRLGVSTQNVNLAAAFGVRWTERPMLPSEL